MKRLLESQLPYDVVIAACALVAVLCTSGRAWPAWPVHFLAGVVFAVTVTKHGVAHFVRVTKDDVHPLEGCLDTLFGVLLGPEIDQDAGLRITLHVPYGPDRLQQLTDYVCRNSDAVTKKRAGRKFNAKAGIIGKALREKQPHVGTRTNENHDAFIREMVQDWSYHEPEARELTPDRMSWVAWPLINDSNTVEAILYCDSNDPDFFTEDRQKLIECTCSGIANFAKRRYK